MFAVIVIAIAILGLSAPIAIIRWREKKKEEARKERIAKDNAYLEELEEKPGGNPYKGYK